MLLPKFLQYFLGVGVLLIMINASGICSCLFYNLYDIYNFVLFLYMCQISCIFLLGWLVIFDLTELLLDKWQVNRGNNVVSSRICIWIYTHYRPKV